MSKFVTSKKEFEAMMKEADGEPLAVIPIEAGNWQQYRYGATGDDRAVYKGEVLEYPVEWRDTHRNYTTGDLIPHGPVRKDGVRVKVTWLYNNDETGLPEMEEMIVQRKWFRGLWAPHQEKIDEWEKKHARDEAEKLYYVKLGEAAGMFYMGEDRPLTRSKFGFPSRDFEADKDHQFTCNLGTLLHIITNDGGDERVIMPLEKWMLAYDNTGQTPKSPFLF